MRRWLIVALTLAWLCWELVSAFDGNASTWPLTEVVVKYIPWWITLPAVAMLVIWLPIHFIGRYRRKRSGA